MRDFGFVNKAKWALIEAGPLTASGANEVLYTAPTKKDLQEIAKEKGLKIGAHNATVYSIVKMEDVEFMEETPWVPKTIPNVEVK